VPAEVFDTGAPERGVPSLRTDLLDRRPLKAEHMRGMLPDLPTNGYDRFRIQRHSNCLSRFGLIGMYPR
jgi:hypothetical protein